MTTYRDMLFRDLPVGATFQFAFPARRRYRKMDDTQGQRISSGRPFRIFTVWPTAPVRHVTVK